MRSFYCPGHTISLFIVLGLMIITHSLIHIFRTWECSIFGNLLFYQFLSIKEKKNDWRECRNSFNQNKNKSHIHTHTKMWNSKQWKIKLQYHNIKMPFIKYRFKFFFLYLLSCDVLIWPYRIYIYFFLF